VRGRGGTGAAAGAGGGGAGGDASSCERGDQGRHVGLQSSQDGRIGAKELRVSQPEKQQLRGG